MKGSAWIVAAAIIGMALAVGGPLWWYEQSPRPAPRVYRITLFCSPDMPQQTFKGTDPAFANGTLSFQDFVHLEAVRTSCPALVVPDEVSHVSYVVTCKPENEERE